MFSVMAVSPEITPAGVCACASGLEYAGGERTAANTDSLQEAAPGETGAGFLASGSLLKLTGCPFVGLVN